MDQASQPLVLQHAAWSHEHSPHYYHIQILQDLAVADSLVAAAAVAAVPHLSLPAVGSDNVLPMGLGRLDHHGAAATTSDAILDVQIHARC